MAFDFPSSPTVGQKHPATPIAGIPQYIWDGEKWTDTGAVLPASLVTRNRLVNGAMQHSQQWDRTLLQVTGNYVADQWCMIVLTTGLVQTQWVQAVTPNGSLNRIRTTVATADATLTAAENYNIWQAVEGFCVDDIGWGTAAAKQLVLRFGFKAPAGTYSVQVNNNNNDRCYIANFTIQPGQANTDTEQVIIIPGDTIGTWLTNGNVGLLLRFCYGAGPTYTGVAGWQGGALKFATPANTNGLANITNVFELFDVGLYVDATKSGVPPKWEPPDYATELERCMRYWGRFENNQCYGYGLAAGGYVNNYNLPVLMRASPTLTFYYEAYHANCSGLTGYGAQPHNFSTVISTTALGTFHATFSVVASARL